MVSTLAVNNGWVATFVSDGTTWNYQGQVTWATFNAPRVLIGSLSNPGNGVAGQVLRTDGAKTLSWITLTGLAPFVTINGTNTNTASAATAAVNFLTGRNAAGAIVANATTADIGLEYGASGYKHYISSTHSGGVPTANNAIKFYTNNSAAVAGSSAPGTGNVLSLDVNTLGVNIPTGNMKISGTAIPTLQIDGNTDNQIAGTLFLSQTDAYGFKIAYDATNTLDGMRITERRANVETERMTFKSGGNVGIGVSDPTQKLDVAGTIKTTGDILLTGASVLNFGSDLTKEANAGKIGYGTFTANTLDILGATVGAALPRSIKLWDNVITNGTLTVAGATTLSSTLGVTGQTTINVGANSSTLPTTRGTAGQALTTDGAGTLSWSGSAGDINGAWAGGAGQPGGTCNGRLLNNSTLCAINLSLNRGGANVNDGTTCTLPVGCSSIQPKYFYGRNKEANTVTWLVNGRTVTCVSGCGSQDVFGTEVIAL